MKLLLDLKNKPGKLNKLPFGKLPIGLLAHDKKPPNKPPIIVATVNKPIGCACRKNNKPPPSSNTCANY